MAVEQKQAPAPQGGQQAQQKQQSALVEIKRDTADLVAAKVSHLQRAGELVLPQNYAAPNALKSAWLMLQSVKDTNGRLALTACTKDSIYNAMLDMVVQGLNPAKKQCYFIAYGDQLGCQRSYFGDEQVARNIRPDVDIYYQVIYEGDEFEQSIVRGKAGVAKHIQKFENVDPKKIKGAYCVIEDQQGRIVNSSIMTIDQIRQSWKMSKTYKPEGGSSFHHSQPDQACLRTVIRRACKPVINSSNDSWLMQAVQREEMAAEVELADEAATYANGELIDITDVVDGATEAETGADEQVQSNAAPEPAQAKQSPTQGQRISRQQQTLGVGAQQGPGY